MEEIELESGLIDTDIPMSCIPEDDEELAWSNWEIESGVFKVFNNLFYNQRLVDNYSCTLVSAFTALSNSKNVEIPLSLIQEAFKDFKESGKFTPWVGAKLSDGAEYAVKHFNGHFGTSIKHKTVPFTIQNAIRALKTGFAFTSWIKYGKQYFKDEQDDGRIAGGEGVIGKNWHAIAFVKINTENGEQFVKYIENYRGVLKHDIIFADFKKLRPLFFNTMVTFYE